MTLQTSQRFLTGLTVFDTYNGLNGTISQMNLDSAAINPLGSPYTGAYFVVLFSDGTTGLFTLSGRRVDLTTGAVTNGVTLLTSSEKNTLISIGYPAAS